MPSCNTYSLIGFLLPWACDISSRLLQQSAAIAPYLKRGVTPHHRPSKPSTWDSSSKPSCTHAAATTAPWTSHYSLAAGKYREGTQLHPSTENRIKDLLSMAPPIRIRPSFPLSQSLPSGSFHKPLILLHQRADRLKITITEN